jgi:hypothetical protein
MTVSLPQQTLNIFSIAGNDPIQISATSAKKIKNE